MADLPGQSSSPRLRGQAQHLPNSNFGVEGGEVIASELVHRMTKHPSQAELVEQTITNQFQQTEQQRLDFSEMEIEAILNEDAASSRRLQAGAHPEKRASMCSKNLSRAVKSIKGRSQHQQAKN